MKSVLNRPFWALWKLLKTKSLVKSIEHQQYFILGCANPNYFTWFCNQSRQSCSYFKGSHDKFEDNLWKKIGILSAPKSLLHKNRQGLLIKLADPVSDPIGIYHRYHIAHYAESNVLTSDSLPPQMSCATSRRSSRPSVRSSTRPSPRCPATKPTKLLPVCVSLYLRPTSMHHHHLRKRREKSLLFHTSFNNTITLCHLMTSMVASTLRWVGCAELSIFFTQPRSNLSTLSHTIPQIYFVQSRLP